MSFDNTAQGLDNTEVYKSIYHLLFTIQQMVELETDHLAHAVSDL